MIRKATPADIPAIVALGIEALERGAYENMVISRAKVEAIAREAVSSPADFCWIAVVDGEVRGALTALVHECTFYERKQATVIQFYCPGAPAHFLALLREFLRWARGRPVIKLIVFSLEHDADPRLGALLSRLGLSKALPAYIETR